MEWISGTQTYKRRSKKERLKSKQKIEQHKTHKLLKERDVKAIAQRRKNQRQHSNISYQILNREITGTRSSIKCAKSHHYSPVDSLLTLYQKKLNGNALSRLSVLTKGDKTLERELLEGNLCLLGYPQGNHIHPLPMIGFRIDEQDDVVTPLGNQWNRSLWQKSIELCFMNISYHPVSYKNTDNTTTGISRSNSDTSKESTKSKSNNIFPRSKSFHAEPKTTHITKAIALLRPITTVRCCSVGIETHRLCVHQSPNNKLFYVYNGIKERTKKSQQRNTPKTKKTTRGTLPNSHASRLSSFGSSHSGAYSNYNEIDLSHYQNDSLDIPSFSLFSPGENSEEEESDAYVCIVASPLEHAETCASLFISFPCSPSIDAFDPKYCVYNETEKTVWIVLNLRHCLYRVQVSYDPDEFYVPPDDIETNNDSVSFSYYPENEESATFIHPRYMQGLDVDRYLYSLIKMYSPHLSHSLLQFSTLILAKTSENTVMVQIVFYATSGDSQGEDGASVRGGYLLLFDIISGSTEVLHFIPPISFTNVETVHEWAVRMADETKEFANNAHARYTPNRTWDNSAYINSTPMKFLTHPTYPFVLVNDLLHRIS